MRVKKVSSSVLDDTSNTAQEHVTRWNNDFNMSTNIFGNQQTAESFYVYYLMRQKKRFIYFGYKIYIFHIFIWLMLFAVPSIPSMLMYNYLHERQITNKKNNELELKTYVQVNFILLAFFAIVSGVLLVYITSRSEVTRNTKIFGFVSPKLFMNIEPIEVSKDEEINREGISSFNVMKELELEKKLFLHMEWLSKNIKLLKNLIKLYRITNDSTVNQQDKSYMKLQKKLFKKAKAKAKMKDALNNENIIEAFAELLNPSDLDLKIREGDERKAHLTSISLLWLQNESAINNNGLEVHFVMLLIHSILVYHARHTPSIIGNQHQFLITRVIPDKKIL